MDLQTDADLRNMVSHYLYDSSDIVADFCMEQDKVTLDFFYSHCPYVHEDETENESVEQTMS